MNSGEMLPALTKRELQILGLMAEGFSAKVIALKFAIAHRTVETHIDTMRLKLRARNRTHLVAMAISSRLLVFPADSFADFSLITRLISNSRTGSEHLSIVPKSLTKRAQRRPG